jgi:hypothetical protein
MLNLLNTTGSVGILRVDRPPLQIGAMLDVKNCCECPVSRTARRRMASVKSGKAEQCELAQTIVNPLV